MQTSRAEAAEKLNVSERTVNAAKKVQTTGTPELQDKVERGQVSVSAAATAASLPKEEQREIVEEINAGGKPAEVVKAHVANNSADDEWYTPAKFIEAARILRPGRIKKAATSKSCGLRSGFTGLWG